MKTWTPDNPKASLMKRKRAAIVDAARRAFLESGYASTSMDRIAAEAGVSIKTVYRHFDNKDDLFSAVMQAACSQTGGFEGVDEAREDQAPPLERSWFSKPPAAAFVMAGVEYLEHVLSAEQLALYRVVTQDAPQFPELGRRYREEVVEQRNALFTRYLDRWAPAQKWKVRNRVRVANAFAGMLRAGLFEDALHGLRSFSEAEILAQAQWAATNILVLLKAGSLE
jgi:TetR/AcrR family transcriptional repressor of mexJK operon